MFSNKKLIVVNSGKPDCSGFHERESALHEEDDDRHDEEEEVVDLVRNFLSRPHVDGLHLLAVLVVVVVVLSRLDLNRGVAKCTIL